MTIGEIKLEALRISFPDPQLYVDESDTDTVSAIISGLKEDHNYSDFLAASVGSINRALSVMERKGISPLVSRSATVRKDASSQMQFVDMNAYGSEMLFAEGVYKIKDGNTVYLPFEDMGNGKLALTDAEENGPYVIKYRTKLERISALTPDDKELSIPDSLASAIPYFIKGDLLCSEEPDASAQAMARFDSLCTDYPRQFSEHSSVISVYRQEEIT